MGLCWEGGWVGHGVWIRFGCPCPPVRNDIVTPRHLFIVTSLMNSVCIDNQIYHGRETTGRMDLNSTIEALKPSRINAQNPSDGIQPPKGMISSF